MLLTIALSHIFVEIKNSLLNKIGRDIATKFWSAWELRLMIIISLILQLLLLVAGNFRRRYIGKKLPYMAMGVWLVYLLADVMATLVLSTLLRADVKQENVLIVFWTPFLLWHLGSPHNITAYSLEDTEIWLRHFLGMVFLTLEAIYIYVRFRSHTSELLNVLAIPIFIAAVFKYAERIRALRSANNKQLINSLYSFKRDSVHTQLERYIRIGLPESSITDCFKSKGYVPELQCLRQAYSSFIIFKPLFFDLTFGLSQEHCQRVYSELESAGAEQASVGAERASAVAEQAFKQIGLELGYLYDLLFTKMPIHHDQPKVSWLLRAFCFLSAVSTLIVFTAMVEKHLHSKVDIVITYLLLLGVICLDIYSFIMHVFSTWAMVWLPNPTNKVLKLYSETVATWLPWVEGQMEIRSMAQHDLINYYVKATKNKFIGSVRVIDIGNISQKYCHTSWKTVDRELKQFIYSHLKEKRQKWEGEGFPIEKMETLLNGKNLSIPAELTEEFEEETTDFTQRIFLWHFATKLVYYDDMDNLDTEKFGPNYQIATSLCDYMMYLVLARPMMLPKGFSEVINVENYKQVKNFFQVTENMKKANFSEIRKLFTSAVLAREDFHMDSKYSIEVTHDGQRFALILKSLEEKYGWDHEQKWELICKVWMEMMVHAASRCSWTEHAQQLRHGGELLTHVALLMAHFGLTTQIRRQKDDDINPLSQL